jgi:transcription-repair coupling factor (superfamily II helicase)
MKSPDRFGPLPEPVGNLITVADLRRRAHRHRIERLDAGPDAIAATFRPGADLEAMKRSTPANSDLTWRGDRLVLLRPTETAEARRNLAGKLIDAIARWESRRRVRRRAPEPVAG